ncbi:MAG TPA: GNAT family N-acetyltransferase [Bacteroidales bacterium]|nr:GNAT family N-acetyltransferase [Bacteroidales bacterium]
MKYLLTGESTRRLTFRLLDRSFFEEWIEFFKDPDSARFLGFADIGSPYEQSTEWFRRIEERYRNDLGGLNALIDIQTNRFIGQCGLLIQEIDGKTEMEIGYSIMPEFRNKGYATEAAVKCRDFAFTNNLTETLISIIHIENINSEKVALNSGMVRTRQTEFRNMPVNIFRIDKPAWSDLKKI